MMKHRKNRWPRIYSAVLTLLASAIVATYLIMPGVWQWDRAEAQVEAREIHQMDTVAGPIDAQLVELLRGTAAATSSQTSPVIITYHNIGYDRSRYTVTPENFASQMRLIHDAGWTTLTSGQLDRWLKGEPVPSHSVMITFDDGTQGVWQYADPVLARYGQHASAFIITGFVGTHAPYYMTWEQITELHNSGRWDLEAHTHMGHVKIPTDSHGGQEPFLTAYQWLPEEGRNETMEEYRTRVFNDLAECKHQFALHGLPIPKFLAFPFSAHGGDPNGTDALHQIVLSLYDAALLDDAEQILVTTSQDVWRGLIQRMDINGDTTLKRFSDEIVAASPLDPMTAQPLLDPAGWFDQHRQSAPIDVTGTTVTINPDSSEKVIRNYAPTRSAMWNDYTVTADVGGLGDGSVAGISVLRPGTWLDEQDGRIDVAVYSDTLSVQVVGGTELPPQALFDAPAHHVVVDVTDTQVTITVDDVPPTVIDLLPHAARTVGGGMGLYAYRRSDVNPSLTFSNLTVS
jgi:poly-beta-1,6-N-acetyl-D-glucosamine N-deacetylase